MVRYLLSFGVPIGRREPRGELRQKASSPVYDAAERPAQAQSRDRRGVLSLEEATAPSRAFRSRAVVSAPQDGRNG
eukprot:6201246-Pleurochrysis_carterae.AAC.1